MNDKSLIKGSENAVIILHEIYGLNQFILDVCNQYSEKGYDVFCPDLLGNNKVYSYAEADKAYQNFDKEIKHSSHKHLLKLGERIKSKYKHLFIIGFSVGATVAWSILENELFDGAVLYYGSRIRDNMQIVPKCPTLLIFAEHEQSFRPQEIMEKLIDRKNISVTMFDAKHGFMDHYSENYCPRSAEIAEQLATSFIHKLDY